MDKLDLDKLSNIFDMIKQLIDTIFEMLDKMGVSLA